MEGHLIIPFPKYAFYRSRNKDATPENWKRFCAEVKELAKKAGFTVQGNAANIVVSLRFFVEPRRGNWDLDRLTNAVLDSLQGVLYRDDKQVVELHAAIWRQSNEPRIEVQFNTLQGEELVEHLAVLVTETTGLGKEAAITMARELVDRERQKRSSNNDPS